MSVIEASKLTKSYKGSKHPALNDISLSIDSKQIFTMLGRNGAGKTTFVRICATQLMPTSGRIFVLGHDVIKHPGRIESQVGHGFRGRRAFARLQRQPVCAIPSRDVTGGLSASNLKISTDEQIRPDTSCREARRGNALPQCRPG